MDDAERRKLVGIAVQIVEEEEQEYEQMMMAAARIAALEIMALEEGGSRFQNNSRKLHRWPVPCLCQCQCQCLKLKCHFRSPPGSDPTVSPRSPTKRRDLSLPRLPQRRSVTIAEGR